MRFCRFSLTDEYNKTVHKAKTPTTITLQKGEGYFHGKDYSVKISKAGYAEQIVTVKSSPSGWYLAGNLLFGGLIGWFIVDPLTGAMWTLQPEAVNAVLAKSDTEQSQINAGTISIVLLKDVPDELKKKMVKVK